MVQYQGFLADLLCFTLLVQPIRRKPSLPVFALFLGFGSVVIADFLLYIQGSIRRFRTRLPNPDQ